MAATPGTFGAADEPRILLALDRVAHAADFGCRLERLHCHLAGPSACRCRFDGPGRFDPGRIARPQLARGLLDRLDDVHVAGAAAEIAADPVSDLGLSGLLVLVEQPGGLHYHPRRAEAALETVLVPEGLLERLEGRPVGHPLDRPDLGAVRLDGEHRARLGALAVHVDRAGTAVARVAADVRTGEQEHIAQEVDEEQPGLDVGFADLAVDGEADMLGRHARHSYAFARA